MQRILFCSLLVLTFISCRKEEGNSFVWDKSFGDGSAYFVSSAHDSGLVACGEKDGNPYLLKLSREKETVLEYESGRGGLFNRVWYDTSVYIASGSSDGDMLLEAVSKSGRKIWDTAITAGFAVDYSRLCYRGSGKLLAVGTAKADSAGSAKGLLMIEFDTTGRILQRIDLPFSGFISAGDPAADASGNLYLPVTRKITGAKLRASLIKYDYSFNMLWLTDLYNNGSFGSSALASAIDNSGFIYVCGATELSGSSGIAENTYTVSMRPTGAIKWKKYLGFSNSGSAVRIDNSGEIMTLSRDCFLVDRITYDIVKDTVITAEPLRWFSSCDPEDTDAFAYDFDIDHDGNFIAAGSLGGKFYLAVKSASQ
jgi:hypothetical protein